MAPLGLRAERATVDPESVSTHLAATWRPTARGPSTSLDDIGLPPLRQTGDSDWLITASSGQGNHADVRRTRRGQCLLKGIAT